MSKPILINSMVDVDELLIEEDAQRTTDLKRAQKIADAWDPNMVGVIKVAMDPETDNLYVIDGGHRTAAAKILGIKQLSAEIHYGLDKKQRADLFLELQRQRRPVSIQDQYLVGVTAGYKRETEIEAVLKSMDLRVGATSGYHTIKSVRALEKIYGLGGPTLLRSTLNHLKVCFGSFPTQMWNASLMGGVGIVLHHNSSNPDFQPKRLANILRKKDPMGWEQLMNSLARGRAGSINRAEFMAEAIINEYNKGLRSKKIPLP